MSPVLGGREPCSGSNARGLGIGARLLNGLQKSLIAGGGIEAGCPSDGLIAGGGIEARCPSDGLLIVLSISCSMLHPALPSFPSTVWDKEEGEL